MQRYPAGVVRLQTPADLRAGRWGLLARLDPDGDDGAISSFWALAPMLSAAITRDAIRLPPRLQELDAAFWWSRSSIRARWYRWRRAAHCRLLEYRGPPGPSQGVGPVGGVRELTGLVKVLDGLRAGKTQRAMARDIWGDARVALEWSSDGWMRSQVRRWIPKAEAMVEGVGANWRRAASRGSEGICDDGRPNLRRMQEPAVIQGVAVDQTGTLIECRAQGEPRQESAVRDERLHRGPVKKFSLRTAHSSSIYPDGSEDQLRHRAKCRSPTRIWLAGIDRGI